LVPCDSITVAIVAEGENDALLLESSDLGNLFGTEVGGDEVALLEIAHILFHVAKAKDKKELAGLKVAQL
jgi:hypothetical protein